MYFSISFIYSFMHLLDQHLLDVSSALGTALGIRVIVKGKGPKDPQPRSRNRSYARKQVKYVIF